MSNQWCDTCGGLVDRIGLQPQGVRFCECRETIEKLRAKLADAKERGKQLAEAQNCIQTLEKELAAERERADRAEAEVARLNQWADGMADAVLKERETGEGAEMSAHTPGPWRYEAGGGHAYNRIRGSDSVQTNGWPERRGGYGNASYSDMVCENLGDVSLPGPAANVRLIAAAPDMLEALLFAARHCLCGARPESPHTRPHVPGCVIAAAIDKATGESK